MLHRAAVYLGWRVEIPVFPLGNFNLREDNNRTAPAAACPEKYLELNHSW